MLTITQIYNNQPSTSADFVYRSAQPMEVLCEEYEVDATNVVSLSKERERLGREADLLIINFAIDPDLLPLIAWRKERALPTLFEINDNFLAFSDSNPVAPFFRNPENRSLIRNFARLCDGVMLSSSHLVDLVKGINDRYFVFEDHLREVPPLQEKTRGERFVIGWGGSSGHLKDLESIAETLALFILKYPDTELRIMSSPKVFGLFSSFNCDRIVHVPTGTLKEYYQFLQGLDVGIACILPTEFNQCRADIKYLEYAACGVAAVCTNFGPYSLHIRHNENGLLYSTSEELTLNLLSLYQDAALLDKIRNNAYNYVALHRVEKYQIHERAELYSNILGKKIPKGKGQYRLIDLDKNEIELFNAGASLLNGKNLQKADQTLKALLPLMPGHYQARIIHAKILEALGDQERTLLLYKEALSINPLSVHALEGIVRLTGNIPVEFPLADLEEDLKYANILFRALAEREFQKENQKQAENFLLKAVIANPFSPESLSMLASHCINTSNFANAQRIAEELLKWEEADPRAYHYLARCAMEKKDLKTAKYLWEKCLQLAPGFTVAEQSLAALKKYM